jgi:hypothetical protein
VPLIGLAPSSWANLAKPIFGKTVPGGWGGLDQPEFPRKNREVRSGFALPAGGQDGVSGARGGPRRGGNAFGLGPLGAFGRCSGSTCVSCGSEI